MDMTLEGLLLLEQMHLLEEEGTDQMPEERFALVERMFELIAGLVECPEHGAVDPATVGVNISMEDQAFGFALDGLCCGKVKEPVERKISEFVEASAGKAAAA